MRSLSLVARGVGSFALLAACSDSGPGSRQPIDPDRSIVAEHTMTPEQMRELAGVDRLPEILDKNAFRASLERNYPSELRADAVSGSALIDVLVDERGRVESVTAISRPRGMNTAMILEEKDGTQRRVTPNDHPAFQAAAVKALHEVQFSPAIRDDQAVPYTLRMTVSFGPPARRD